MAEYIDREKLKEAILEDAINSLQFCDQYALDFALMDVDEAPSADVRPVVHGRWEPGNPICPICGESKFKELDADIWADWMPPYCPNCGADMREEKL